MGAAVTITCDDLDAAGLRREAACCRDANAARRMLALALVLDGRTRGEAAALCGMDRQTLRDWVRRYNVEGVAGLSDRPQLGRTPKLTAEQEAEIAELVRTGPDLTAHGVIRWRRKDLAQVIERRFGVALAERSVGAMLKRLGFRPLSVRPRHPGHDAQAQASFGQTSPPS
jgi:transposase